MDFDKFASDKTGCYVAENGFLLWKICGNDCFEQCVFSDKGRSIIAHLLLCKGEIVLRHGEDVLVMNSPSIGCFVDRPMLQLLSVSADVTAYVLISKDEFTGRLFMGNPPIPYTFLLKVRQSPIDYLDDNTLELYSRRVEEIMKACADDKHIFRVKKIKCAIWMFIMDIVNLYMSLNGCREQFGAGSRSMELFTRFMRLLPEHVATEHLVTFYAARLCVTPQYLNRVVKSVSGRSVSYWINFTLVGEISQRLLRSDDTIQLIATRLGFTDQSVMAKFYKRQTGCSMSDYKKKVLDVIKGQ
ncbi:MAG: helix-turn-helix domain-containing protein [Prevotella sp.]